MKYKINLFPALILFISGMAALIYQTLWVKQLGLVVGVDVYAVTTGISAFFAGLAAGGFYFGRRADSISKPFFLVAMLELGIAFWGLGGTFLLSYTPSAFVTLNSIAGPAAWILPFILIGAPAFLMGGTLPAIIRGNNPEDKKIGRISGLFYAANTFGAIIGTLMVPFLLVPELGVYGTAGAAALLNLLAALGAYLLSIYTKAAANSTAPDIKFSAEAKFALLLYSLAGGIALGYEVVWSQTIAPFLSSRIYAFAVMLSVYLSGLVLGSYLYSYFADRVKQPWKVFGLLISSAGLSALLIFVVTGPWVLDTQDSVGKLIYSYFQNNMLANSGRFVFTAGVILLIPTILLGAAFPAASRIVAGHANVGRDIGAVAALNTAGGILGSLATGFLLIPLLGLVYAMGFLAVAAVVTGGMAVLYVTQKRTAAISLLSALIVLTGFTAINLPEDKFAQLLVRKHGGEVVFYEESAGGSVAVLEQQAPAGIFNRLYIQGVSNSGNSLTSTRYMRLQALLPLIIHNGEPRSALVIGFGTGITLGSLLAYPELETRVCAELLPGVLNAAEYFRENGNVANDPEVEIRINDGRHELLGSSQNYDLITLEPPPPSAAGVANLYSSEFYELAAERLNSNGLVAQWWPLAAQNMEDSKSIVRSFLDVFPYVTLWSTELHETLLVGSMQPIELNFTMIQSRFEDPQVSGSMKEIGVLSVIELLSTYITDGAGLELFAADAQPVTDNHPVIEYAGWTRKGEFPRVLTEISKLRSVPVISDTDQITLDDIDLTRHKLWTLYRAGYYAYTGDSDKWESMLKKLIPEIRSNPYFNWFVNR